MLADEEKKAFVIKQTFTDVKNMQKRKRYYGKKQKHFNIPWSIYMYKCKSVPETYINLECHYSAEHRNWKIITTVNTKILTKTGEEIEEKKQIFGENNIKVLKMFRHSSNYMINGILTIECYVTIHVMVGIDAPITKNFDNELAKEFSDVVLKVKDQKFHVNKMYLAGHSTFFKSLFLGNFAEAKQSEIELKDIDPYQFQKFLEGLYGEPDIDDENVEGTLILADMYDAKAAIRQSELFLLKDSEKSLKEKLILAIQYKLEDLKKKCMSEFKTIDDIASVIPEDPLQIDHAVWKDLLNLSIEYFKKFTQN